eukprot:c28269_g1_i1 orf=1-171(-)
MFQAFPQAVSAISPTAHFVSYGKLESHKCGSYTRFLSYYQTFSISLLSNIFSYVCAS